ncbi:fimbria/pilus outer membrane usher protein [Nostoc sp. NMS7]|uniref:fimbria/pilus outer membrane usher protein n=1 Tax=Nostoc sp. NMS7 TaxID=2815391 RepID=UPI0025CC0C93|nr:fimbria/pilus outer membrane usher protein [Nostoc sp. NMS7]
MAAQDQKAILELTVNQVSQGEIFVILRQSDILVRTSDLEKARLQGFSGIRETINNEIYVSLVSLAPNVSYEYDENNLALRITAQPQLLGSTSVNLGQEPPKNIVYSKDTSAFFNYAFNVPFNGQAFNNYTFSGEAGLSLNGNLLFSSFSRNADGSFLRGLTNLTIDRPKNLNRLVIGDTFANTGDLGGGLFLGGISFSREFELNPYFVRQPTFALSGAVVNPSTVEVFVNGQRVSQQELPPGQFQLNNLVLPVGNDSTKLVIRDAFGREQVITSPFYLSTGLLKPGLSSYSFNLGFRRQNLNSDSLNYGSPVFLGQYTQGISKSLTLGGRLEVSSNLISGGSTLTTALPFGALELSLAASSESGVPGAAASIAYSYSGRSFGFGSSVRLFSNKYANLSLSALDDRPNLEINAFISKSLSRNVSLGLQYALSDFRDRGQSNRISLFNTIQVSNRANLSINLSRSSQPTESSINEVSIGFNYSLGNANANVNQTINDKKPVTTLSLQKSAPVGEGFGYRLQLSPSEEQLPGNGTLRYQAPFGIYELNYDHNSNGGNATNLNASGSIVAIGNNIFFARPVTDSYALIQVPGVRGVRGYISNQEIGQTNSRGNLFIPNLLPYYGNNLRIQDEDIPLDYRVDANEKVIAPSFRSGAIVRFPVLRIQTIIGNISIEASGKTIIPAYGQLTVTRNDKQVDSPIGNQGEFYLENLAPGRYVANVEYAQGVCTFDLNIPHSDQKILNLGSLKCIQNSGK